LLTPPPRTSKFSHY